MPAFLVKAVLFVVVHDKARESCCIFWSLMRCGSCSMLRSQVVDKVDANEFYPALLLLQELLGIEDSLQEKRVRASVYRPLWRLLLLCSTAGSSAVCCLRACAGVRW